MKKFVILGSACLLICFKLLAFIIPETNSFDQMWQVQFTSDSNLEEKSVYNTKSNTVVNLLENATQTNTSMWKYSTGGEGYTVGETWNSDLNFDDNSWQEGAAGFGNGSINGAFINTNWNNETIYLRKKIKFDGLTQEQIDNLKMSIFYDEDFEIYINGVLALSETGYITSYEERDLNSAAKAAIIPGQDNLIAVKCIQKTGWQYIDVGLFTNEVVSGWVKKEAPVMTTWSESINPNNVHAEYPRPQMIRDTWMNLNGVWDFARRETKNIGTYNAEELYNKKILVPFPIESALSGIMDNDYGNESKSYVYKRNFTVPASMAGKQVLLHFGAVDWHSVVFVNGTKVGEHKGGFDPFFFDVTDALNRSTQQELVVQVYDPTNGGQPKGKQRENPHQIWYTPSSGIWQTVWIEGVEATHISDFTIVPDIDNYCVRIKIDAQNADESTVVEIDVIDEGSIIATKTGKTGQEIVLPVIQTKLWSPDSPFLYDLKFRLKKGETVVDNVDSYFGMRKVALDKVDGVPYVFLNNKPIFQYGLLDQGYWPDGLFTAPSYDAMIFDLDKTKELGCNMTRKHMKVEPATWYHYCDKIGLLVWQDMPMKEEFGSLGDENWIKQNFYREMENMIKTLKNCPSIIMWVPYNEAWGQYRNTQSHTEEGVNVIKNLDKTRIINAASGWQDYEVGDMIDFHSYPFPSLYANPVNRRANVCGEAGGFSLKIDNHVWKDPDFSYLTVSNQEELTQKLEEFNDAGFVLTRKGTASGPITALVYTQISDVEGEANGVLTYDRKVEKLNATQKSRFKAGIEKLKNSVALTVLEDASQNSSSIWKYSTGGNGHTVGNGWNNDFNFDDSSWSEGRAGFGNMNPPGSFQNTTWNNETIYLRKKVKIGNLTSDQIDKLKLSIYHDEDYEVYINGVLASSGTSYSTSYISKDINQLAKDAIILGQENLIAVKCIQTSGGQYIDIGIYTEGGTLTEPETPGKPEITDMALGGNSPYLPGSIVDVTATIKATNPIYTWSCTGGTLTDGDLLSPKWTLPDAEGKYQITLKVTDDIGEISLAKEIEVKKGVKPEIISFTLSGNSPYLPESVIDVAAEIKSSNPTYEWTCTGGTLTGENTLSPKWTLPSQEGEYKVTLTVRDAAEEVSSTKEVTVKRPLESGAKLEELYINGVLWDISKVYALDCANINSNLDIEIVPSTNATINIGHTVIFNAEKAGLNVLQFTITSEDESKTETYKLNVTKPFPFYSIVTQMWDNTLTVNNNPETNGGYKFKTFAWYKNGLFIGYKQYYSAGRTSDKKLDANAQYSVKMIDENGIPMQTCPTQLTLENLKQFGVYPNPVKVGEVINLETGLNDEQDATLKVSGMNGVIVHQQAVKEQTATFQLTSPGIYTVELISKGNIKRTAKIIVK